MSSVLRGKIKVSVALAMSLISIAATWAVTFGVMRDKGEDDPNTDPKITAENGSGTTTAPPTTPTTVKAAEELYMEAVKDAMTVEDGEILPLVSLVESDSNATFNEAGQVLLLTFHKYPDSYPDSSDVTNTWGEVWTFTPGELASWYKENKAGVTDWSMRFKQLIGLTPDNDYTHFTAMWVNLDDVIRPANVQSTGQVGMNAKFSEGADESYKAWFDGNIIWSYFDSAYPWTRLGYTYDWADNGKEYGLTEFLLEKGSNVKIAYTVTVDKMVEMLEKDEWKPAA